MTGLDTTADRIAPDAGGTRLGLLLWLAVIALFALANVMIEVASGLAILNGELRGPDSYMRLLRVTQLFETGEQVLRRGGSGVVEVLESHGARGVPGIHLDVLPC